MWGIHGKGTTRHLRNRITPTYVGNTPGCGWDTGRKRDHPHVCGEYNGTSSLNTFGSGSPPRMWGIPKAFSLPYRSRRITPTYVGNTVPVLHLLYGHEDHPHVCGEYSLSSIMAMILLGSPPRMWGIQLILPAPESEIRITPTYVGNTVKDPSLYVILTILVFHFL